MKLKNDHHSSISGGYCYPPFEQPGPDVYVYFTILVMELVHIDHSFNYISIRWYFRKEFPAHVKECLLPLYPGLNSWNERGVFISSI